MTNIALKAKEVSFLCGWCGAWAPIGRRRGFHKRNGWNEYCDQLHQRFGSINCKQSSRSISFFCASDCLSITLHLSRCHCLWMSHFLYLSVFPSLYVSPTCLCVSICYHVCNYVYSAIPLFPYTYIFIFALFAVSLPMSSCVLFTSLHFSLHRRFILFLYMYLCLCLCCNVCL